MWGGWWVHGGAGWQVLPAPENLPAQEPEISSADWAASREWLQHSHTSATLSAKLCSSKSPSNPDLLHGEARGWRTKTVRKSFAVLLQKVTDFEDALTAQGLLQRNFKTLGDGRSLTPLGASPSAWSPSLNKCFSYTSLSICICCCLFSRFI